MWPLPRGKFGQLLAVNAFLRGRKVCADLSTVWPGITLFSYRRARGWPGPARRVTDYADR
ncbi:hypothetical protein Atai01_47230 [Amycolatopsis taiwanensis]|uniref:Uncharacterized protein n=1 Tax=Amycolatopsis taiwanensis TaxID=342230 RepID=A0A9W6R223_9PSEU|nr:hypothetical protein Atai01_47230 [Amycolatopsis taiwanensis]